MQSAVRSPAYSGYTAPTPTSMQPNVGQNPQKRRRTDSISVGGNGVNSPQRPQQFVQHDMNHTPMDPQLDVAQGPPQPMHIPKRGARACTACRKGKNRCEGEVKASASMLLGCEPLTVPPRPGPSLRVVDAKSTIHPAFSKSQRRKMSQLARPPASSESLGAPPKSPSLILNDRRLSRLEGQYLVHPVLLPTYSRPTDGRSPF